jgi:hypothetical protein
MVPLNFGSLISTIYNKLVDCDISVNLPSSWQFVWGSTVLSQVRRNSGPAWEEKLFPQGGAV